ncbi:hypothetical protein BDA96_02G158300 [Sorghum bicolor]|jgi:hypothetical protein|uniref:Uncharacterized protein n=1 Tax=Sorghum bicolor TaxID=4558 RepID=A0A921RMW7_SORBI|nr:hypothetical protein BDA96_02G158300 [Sorghum bicolor]
MLGYRVAHPSIDNASVFPDDDEPPPLPAESCDRLTIAVYRRGQGQGQEEQAEETDPDCAFCLSAVPDGEEVRELPTQGAGSCGATGLGPRREDADTMGATRRRIVWQKKFGDRLKFSLSLFIDR